MAVESKGFSMAYVQETIVSALLESAHYGKPPSDDSFLTSFATLKEHSKSASTLDEEIAERESIGFGIPNRRASLVERLDEFEIEDDCIT